MFGKTCEDIRRHKTIFGNYYKIFILSFSKDDCSASVGTHTAAEVSMPTLT